MPLASRNTYFLEKKLISREESFVLEIYPVLKNYKTVSGQSRGKTILD
jgi:hypothetical protein